MPRPERLVDPEGGPVQRFAVGLRELRRQAGNPGYRELARRAHYSPSTLAQAARGESLPSLPVAMAYARACGGDVAEWEARWRATAEELEPHPRHDDDDRAPYVGLAAYGPDDAKWFCGRDRLIAALIDRVARQRFVAVVGASGSGKSSLLRAGLLPAVLAAGEHWATLVITPGAHPLWECAVRLGAELGLAAGGLVDGFAEHPRNLGLAIRQLMAVRGTDAEFLLIVDQFEESFTLCGDDRERDQFIAALLDAAHDSDGRTRVVVGLRADFYAHCARHSRLVEAMQDAQVLVGPTSTEELGEAITQPAVRAGLMVEKTLVAAVVSEAARQPGALPFVSHALWETWRRRHGNGLFLNGYRAAGGVQGAVAQSADHVYGGLDERQQRTARGILVRLTALGEGTEDTRRRVARTELGADATTAEVLDRLADARLITLAEDTVEIAHEALISGWPTLREWLTADREALRAHRRLTDAAAEWNRHERNEEYLYRGSVLAVWQDRVLDPLNEVERAFLAASVTRQNRERLARQRRLRLSFMGLGIIVVVVSMLAALAVVQANRVAQERDLAFSRQLAAAARSQSQLDPELGLLLAREAYRVNPNPDSEAALRQAAVDSHVRATVAAHEGKVTGVAFSLDGKHLATSGADGVVRVWAYERGRVSTTAPVVLRGHRGEVWTPVFSRDGSRIAAAGVDGTATVWEWASGAPPVVLSGHEDKVWSVAFSRDGHRVASASEDGTVRIWDVDGNELSVLPGHDGRVLGVSFSPDGLRVASSGGDNTVRIWTLDGSRPPIVLQGHENSVESVSFSPDGLHLVTASTDGTVRVWDASGSPGSVVLGTHDGTAESAVYSDDGRWIASTGNDGTVRVWNAASHARPLVLRGHHGTVWAAAFNPDERTLASASDDGTARVWDIDEVGDLTVLRGHTGPVWRAVFSPDGRTLASVGDDGTMRLWDTTGKSPPVVLDDRDGPVAQVAFSRDGRRVATVAQNGTVRIRPATGEGEPVSLRDPDGPIWQVAFSPDGQRILTANGRNAVRIWNTSGAGGPTELLGGHGALYCVAWSPDGQHIASAGTDGAVLVWDLKRPSRPVVFPGPQGLVWTVTFSQDGKRVASGGNDGSVRVVPVHGDAEPLVLLGHQGVVWSVEFSEDGRTLATSGNDATVRLWRLADTANPVKLQGFRASVETVALSPEGKLATAHDDGTVRVWRCEVCGPITDVLDFADQHSTRQLTAEERKTFLNESDT